MRALTDKDIIEVFREEWDSRVASLTETVVVAMTAKIGKGEEKMIIAPELKVLHKNSGIRYTVDSVGPNDCILRTPEGEKFLIDAEELEKNYELSLQGKDHEQKEHTRRSRP